MKQTLKRLAVSCTTVALALSCLCPSTAMVMAAPDTEQEMTIMTEEAVQDSDDTTAVTEEEATEDATSILGEEETGTQEEEAVPAGQNEATDNETTKEEILPEGIVCTVTISDEEEHIVTVENDGTQEAAFDRLVKEAFFDEVITRTPARYGTAAGRNLIGVNSLMYQMWLVLLSQINNGDTNGTTVRLNGNASPLSQLTYTAEDLHVDKLVENGELTAEARAAAEQIFTYSAYSVVDALVKDRPDWLWWYGYRFGSGSHIELAVYSDGAGNYTVGASQDSTLSLTIYPATQFAITETSPLLNLSALDAVYDAATNAKNIVSEASSYSDYDKLRYYANRICELTDYEYGYSSITYTDNNSPWNAIYVFDGDPDTKVVCEGYSKAYQWLCDMTDFSDARLYCMTVTGDLYYDTSYGGMHMWNIMHMEDGYNYIVDLTNDDMGTACRFGKFLAGYDDVRENGYTIVEGNIVTGLVYDNDTKSIYADAQLSIRDEDYTPGETHEHVFEEQIIPPGCDNDGYTLHTCTICGYSYTDHIVPADGHNYEITETVRATCEQGGYRIYKCTDCDHFYYDWFEEALGHNWSVEAESFTDDQVIQTLRCENCDEITYSSWDRIDITGDTVTIYADTANEIYTGSPITKKVTVAEYGYNIPSDCYSVSYQNNTAVGTATITVNGERYYKGTATYTFEIVAKDIANTTITPAYESTTYTGKAIKPAITVKNGSKTLVNNTDYSLAYRNNTNVGTATVIIVGKGSYTGQTSITFEILPKDINDVTLSNIEDAYTRTGRQIRPVPTLKNGMTILKENTDYTLAYGENINTSGSLTITGKGNYTGERTKTFAITSNSIAQAEITLEQDEYVYTGNAITPEPAVTYNGTTLSKGTDYTLSYKNNKAVGEATITVTGIGAYDGSADITFQIIKYSLAEAECTIPQEQYTYTGSAIKPEVTASYNGLTLTEGTDYEVLYDQNRNIGFADITIIGKGAYEGTRTLRFEIVPIPITDAFILGFNEEYAYNGEPILPGIYMLYQGNMLTKGTDYTVEYGNNTAANTSGVIQVYGIGNYSGMQTASFRIIPADISSAQIRLDQTSYEWEGKAVEPPFTVVWNDAVLVKDTDYTVAFSGNNPTQVTDDINATITITGINNFIGTAMTTFTITKGETPEPEKKDINDAEFSIPQTSYQYTGEEICPEVTLTYKGSTLTKDTDFTVTYASNVEAGRATIHITGCGEYAGEMDRNFTIKLATPLLTTILSAGNGIKLNWKRVDGAEKYSLFRRQDGETAWTWVTNTTAAVAVDTTCESGVKYWYTVRAISPTGAYSDYNRTGKSIIFIEAPVLTDISNTTTGVRLSWGKVEGAVGYRVYYKTDTSGWQYWMSTKSVAMLTTDVVSGETYQFTVKAIAPDGSLSTHDLAGKRITWLAAPTITRAESIDNGIRLEWDVPEGVTKYRIYRCDERGIWTYLKGVTKPYYTDTTAESGKTYRYSIQGVSDDGTRSGQDTVGVEVTR